jgi:hypothetical protein
MNIFIIRLEISLSNTLLGFCTCKQVTCEYVIHSGVWNPNTNTLDGFVWTLFFLDTPLACLGKLNGKS